MQNGKIKIYSIFKSIDGEVNYFHQGCLTTFIRFSGCNLRCGYCDTKYAQDINSGVDMTIKEILDKVDELGGDKVTITGGEPLYQKAEFYNLTKALWWARKKMSVETNGSIKPVGYGVHSWVMDFKLPSSGHFDKMDHDNFKNLIKNDYIKFIISDRNDYDTAVREMNYLNTLCHANFTFGAGYGVLDPRELLEWIKKDNIKVILNVQLHKYLQLNEDR